MSFSEVQRDFVAHIRQPDKQTEFPGIEPRRMKIYSDLLFNNINQFIETSFPVLRSLYSDESWLALVRSFFVDFQCHSPHFIDISRQFVDFIHDEYQLSGDDPSCIKSLCHYEWIEIDVSVDNGTLKGAVKPSGGFSKVALLPASRLLHYSLPVHQLSAEYQPEPESGIIWFYLVYRDHNHEVIFKSINQLMFILLQPLQDGSFRSLLELSDLLQKIIPDMSHETVFKQVEILILSLVEEGILQTVT